MNHKLLTTIGLILFGLGILLALSFKDFGKLRIIACDVGQGDGLLIVTPGGEQIVVDGGPGNKISQCLAKKMPFWDKTIELMVLTHPQKDHMEGLLDLLSRYKVQMVATTGVAAKIELFDVWRKMIGEEGAKIYNPHSGESLVIDEVSLEILWPDASQLTSWQKEPPGDLNESSIVFRLQSGEFCAYFTGDITWQILEGLIDKKCQVLKIAHHGSKTGTNKKIIDLSAPSVALIQVGKNNRYGHPHKEVLELLKGTKILRNDIEGDIELQYDGQEFSLGR